LEVLLQHDLLIGIGQKQILGIFGSAEFLTLRDDVIIRVEVSTDLINWQSGPAFVVFLGRERIGPTREYLVFRAAAPGLSGNRLFVRIHVEAR
jgi:hypothetical protein